MATVTVVPRLSAPVLHTQIAKLAVPPGRTLLLENGLTCTQSCGGFGFGVGVGVGVGVVVVVGVGVGVAVGDGLGLADALASGVGVLVGVGVGLADALALAGGVALALGVGLGDASGCCMMTAASKVAVTCGPFRAAALTVAAGRLAHVVAALRRSFRYACATAALADPLVTMNIPAMMPKVAVWARRNVTDTLSPRCRPARGYRPSLP